METNLLTYEVLTALATHSEPPCLSLYQPTHRHHPDNQQDPLRFRHLVETLEQSLATSYPADTIRSLLEPFEALGSDRDFWNHTLDGIAVLGAPGLFQVYALQRPVPELAVAADRFHTKPLRRFLQSADRFQVLGVSRDEVKLFEGNRDALDEIELAPDVPRTITEALGEELTEPHQTVGSYGGTSLGSAMRHGQGGKKEEVDSDAERFFRAVDQAVLEHHSRPSDLPLLLAALPEHQGVFHQLSKNPFLLDKGITVHPDALALDALSQKAWQVFEPHYQSRLATLADEFTLVQSKALGLDDLQTIAEAAVAGRIATLLIEADREIPGRMDAATGRIQLDDLSHPDVDDVLDDLGERVLSKGGHVVVVPCEHMPTTTGAAAICRF
ncbi:hypothetical protein U5801_24670 [Lamprobacter modestohalophilus]|uniref:baeRF3 domain-containing protein n=1 Tax=Lamprobacter modestohalophilus TaxID=1064514 RepID=UPI002ADECBCC|nr:hypothetical protein [Lamprobacter modestohalophilus]MEA1052977.1 hypothetical protein [Lamprobacter modestohalophilus]